MKHRIVLAISFLNVVVIAGVMFMMRPTTGLPHASAAMDDHAATVAHPLDLPNSTQIAAQVAQISNLPEATAVQNQSDSVSVDSAAIATKSQLSGTMVEKPTVITSGALKSRHDIQRYTTVEGDTLSILATKFGVTSDSIRWSNDLAANTSTLPIGKELVIPPVEGIVYTVKTGDTAASLAQKYGAVENKITVFNDAEVSGLTVGQQIVIPDGRIMAAVATGSTRGGFSFGSGAIYGYNGYDPGNCTWYAAKVRAAQGNPVPANLGNAVTWLKGAQLAGIPTGRTPKAGAVFWKPPSMMKGYYAKYGHVGIVDQVLPDGRVKFSSMNVRGLYSMGYQTLTAEEAAAYSYIY